MHLLVLAISFSLLSAGAATADDGDDRIEISRVKEAVGREFEGLRRPETIITVESEDEAVAADGEDAAADVNAAKSAASREADGSKWNKRWWLTGEFGGEIDYRWTELQTAEDMVDVDHDLSLAALYTVEPHRNWTIRLGLHSGQPKRPLSNWVDAGDIGDTRWLYLSEYWSRHETAVGDAGKLDTQFGSFTYPFDATQLVFDNDLFLPGAYAHYEWKPAGSSNVARAGASVYGAQLMGAGGETGPARVVSARLDCRLEPGADNRVESAVSYHDFINTAAIGQAVATGDWRVGGIAGKGETTNYISADQTGAYMSDYNLADLWVKVELNRSSQWPLELEGEFVRNLAARDTASSECDAYFAGAHIGNRGDPGDWRFGVEYASLEADSALAAVNRGEYATNYEGRRVDASYCPAMGIEWRFTYGWSENLKKSDSDFEFDDEEMRLYITYSW